MKKTTITESERLQLIGLFTVAESLTRQLAAVERAAGELLGVENDDHNYYGHLSDAIYSDGPIGVDGLLTKLGVTVAESAK